MPKPFLTPPPAGEVEECRQLKIPSDKYWLGIFNSALLETTYDYNYEQVEDGHLTPEETAALCYEMFQEYLASAGCSVGVPAPYWDTPEDADDEAPPDEQVWYGRMEGTTFVEDVSIWVITGFIAYSGNIGGAIAFKTFAPRFVLAWKQDGIAGAIRVFIDGVDNGLLDTNNATAGVVEHDYVGDPALEEHDILMVLESLPA